jgi:hypothetical protein
MHGGMSAHHSDGSSNPIHLYEDPVMLLETSTPQLGYRNNHPNSDITAGRKIERLRSLPPALILTACDRRNTLLLEKPSDDSQFNCGT